MKVGSVPERGREVGDGAGDLEDAGVKAGAHLDSNSPGIITSPPTSGNSKGRIWSGAKYINRSEGPESGRWKWKTTASGRPSGVSSTTSTLKSGASIIWPRLKGGPPLSARREKNPRLNAAQTRILKRGGGLWLIN